jgi:hypothetical protein
MTVKRSYELSSQAIGAAQGLVMTFGLLGALFLGVYQVVYEKQTIGRFTTLLVYWAQLQGKSLLNLTHPQKLMVGRSLGFLQQHVPEYLLQLNGCGATSGIIPDKAHHC